MTGGFASLTSQGDSMAGATSKSLNRFFCDTCRQSVVDPSLRKGKSQGARFCGCKRSDEWNSVVTSKSIEVTSEVNIWFYRRTRTSRESRREDSSDTRSRLSKLGSAVGVRVLASLVVVTILHWLNG